MTTSPLHNDSPIDYRQGDNAYQAAGGVVGLRRLVDCFYELMGALSGTERIRAMHPDDLTESKEKLALFLCGYLDGPRLFQQAYGPIRLPVVHQHLAIGPAERDAWLLCMKAAIDQQPYAEDFKERFYHRLCVPAERVRNRD